MHNAADDVIEQALSSSSSSGVKTGGAVY